MPTSAKRPIAVRLTPDWASQNESVPRVSGSGRPLENPIKKIARSRGWRPPKIVTSTKPHSSASQDPISGALARLRLLLVGGDLHLHDAIGVADRAVALR